MQWRDWFKALAGGAGRQALRAKAPSGAESRFFSSSQLPPPAEPEERAEAGGLDFTAAIRAHQAWKLRLLASVEGHATERLDYRRVARDDQCVLGRWIHQQGPQAFPNEPLLDLVRSTHARFHEAAGEVLRASQEGRTEDARRLLATDYHRASVQVQGKLAELYLSGNRRAAPEIS